MSVIASALMLAQAPWASASPVAAPIKSHTSLEYPVSFVNQFIGSTHGGHVFVGATRPHGSVKAVADTAKPDNQGGFVCESEVELDRTIRLLTVRQMKNQPTAPKSRV